MHSRPMTIDKLLQLMVPMSVALDSHTVVHDNTSGHLHVVVKTYHILCVDYFCESRLNSRSASADDPLWDGEGCTSTSTCCELNNPPYFTKQLTSPTTDDIAAILYLWEDSDYTPIT